MKKKEEKIEVKTAEMIPAKPKPPTEGDLIWNSIKDRNVSFFGIVKPLTEYVERVTLTPDQLSLRSKTQSTAIIAMLDDMLNVIHQNGGEKRIERYQIEASKAGFINISRINDAV